MIYKVEHKTEYEYQDSATACYNIVFQKPLICSFQRLLFHEYKINPEPEIVEERIDFFENNYAYFSLEFPHKKLSVLSKSKVVITKPFWQDFVPENSVSWEKVVRYLKSTSAANDIRQFCLDSTLVYQINGMQEYIREVFTPDKPILTAMLQFNSKIYKDFKYRSGYTDISTPLEKLFQERVGVCQDFAHFTIGCLRSLGLAAKYISGYIETIPAPGQKKLKGADASHAWLAIYVPDLGWVEFDPTNNLMVNQQHIRVATGRDFKDVVPMKGIVYSSGTHKLKVAVDVQQIGE
ncbi:MAG: transglutaminase family protein [Saprospiraceae bacterium]|nr:transglutaminase family protein [Saprospiraceae bacterium]